MQMSNLKRYSTVLGCFLLHLIIGMTYLFGNLVTYIISYLHYQNVYNESDIGKETWILSPLSLFANISMFCAGFAQKRFGTKGSLFSFGIFLVLGYGLTYYTVQYSLWTVMVSFGIVSGIGMGCIFTLTVDLVSRIFYRNVSTATGIVLMGFALCGVVFNPIVSWYINPNNLSPELQLGKYRLFNQTEILENVPGVFMLIAGASFGMLVIAVLIIFTPSDIYDTIEESNNVDDSSGFDQKVEYTPKELFRDPSAYLLWLVVFIVISMVYFVQLVYKNFGQTFITDDQFLAELASVCALFVCLSRVVIGILADKIGIKLVFILTILPAVILICTIYETKYLPKEWYFIFICAYSFLAASVFILIPASVRLLYGSTHFHQNFAIIWSGNIFCGCFIPVFYANLLPAVGWRYSFITAGGVLTIGLVAGCLLKLPLLPKRDKNEK